MRWRSVVTVVCVHVYCRPVDADRCHCVGCSPVSCANCHRCLGDMPTRPPNSIIDKNRFRLVTICTVRIWFAPINHLASGIINCCIVFRLTFLFTYLFNYLSAVVRDKQKMINYHYVYCLAAISIWRTCYIKCSNNQVITFPLQIIQSRGLSLEAGSDPLEVLAFVKIRVFNQAFHKLGSGKNDKTLIVYECVGCGCFASGREGGRALWRSRGLSAAIGGIVPVHGDERHSASQSLRLTAAAAAAAAAAAGALGYCWQGARRGAWTLRTTERRQSTLPATASWRLSHSHRLTNFDISQQRQTVLSRSQTIHNVDQLSWAWFSFLRKSADEIVEPWHTSLLTSRQWRQKWHTINTQTLRCGLRFWLRNNVKSGPYGFAVGY